MSCDITEINTLIRRYHAHLMRDENISRPPQKQRGLETCTYFREINPILGTRVNYGYGVSPTGTGKTTSGVVMIIGMNTLPESETFVLGHPTQGRRSIIHVPTNLLLDRWEEELLGLPDGKGGRRRGNFPSIKPEYVGVYRASQEFEEKEAALQKPIVLITYDSGRILANHQPPTIGCSAITRRNVLDLLEENKVPQRARNEIENILSQDIVEQDNLYRLFDMIHDAKLPKTEIDTLSDLLATDFLKEEKRFQLQQHFLEALTNEKKANPKATTIVLLDEVDDRPRGDATSRYIHQFILPECLTFGLTATHLYRNGKTTGDYVFGGLKPAFETPFQEAVNFKEICPMRNIAMEVDVPEKNRAEVAEIIEAAKERTKKLDPEINDSDLDYTDRDLERMARLSGIDDIAIKVLLNGCDPDTGKPYIDMKSVWYCANVGHANTVADKINLGIEAYLKSHPEEKKDWEDFIIEENGEKRIRYAEAVSGRMDDEEINAVITRFRNKDTMALTNNLLMVRGFDDREAELCFQLCPSRSPSRILQQGGREMRLNPEQPTKIANIITFLIAGLEQYIFGELAGGIVIMPKGFEFGPTEGHQNKSRDPRTWVSVDEVPTIITNEKEYQIFRQKMGRNPLKKTNEMLTCEEMVREINPDIKPERFEKEKERLQRRLYGPLAAAYQIREARDKMVSIEDISVRQQPFPVWRIGNYKVGEEEYFCIDKGLISLCKNALFGAVKQRPPEFLPEFLARKYVAGNGADPEFDQLIGDIIDAYLDRPPGTTSIEVKGHTLPVSDMGFFHKPAGDGVDFAVSPELLKPLYEIHKAATEQKAAKWWKDRFSHWKTQEWMNIQDARNALGITSLASEEMAKLDNQWNQIRLKAQTGQKRDPWQEKTITFSTTQAEQFRCANRRTADSEESEFCIHWSSLPALERIRGEQNDPGPATGRSKT